LTLSSLRQLLDDDVKNLSRMTLHSASSSTALAALTASADRDGTAGAPSSSSSSNGGVPLGDISEAELGMIMDRERLFPAHFADSEKEKEKEKEGPRDRSPPTSASASVDDPELVVTIPLEGEMYDVVSPDQAAGMLQGFH
jgi:hypothetical protein